MRSLLGVFALTIVLLNVMLYTMVIRRVTRLVASIADQVSLGNMDAGEFKTKSKDEIGVLTEAMGRMKAQPRAGDEDAGRRMGDRAHAGDGPTSSEAMTDPDTPRQVRDRERPRQGRDGRRLQGVRSAHRAHRRDQDDAQGPASIRSSPSSSWRGSRTRRKAAGRLHHPNIVGVYEYGEDDAVAFIAMEYVEGTGLREYLNRKASFDFAAARRDHDAAAARARVRARARRRPSRHQAGEPDRDRRRRAEGRRLRHRARRHVEPDDGRHGDRHAVVHVARAMPGPGRSISAPTCSAPASCSTSC